MRSPHVLARVCFVCRGKHHTLLHRERPSGSPGAPTSAVGVSSPCEATPGGSSEENNEIVLTHFASDKPINSSAILLATAQIQVHSTTGRTIRVRALLDQGSTWTFISEDLAHALCTRIIRVSSSVSGIGGVSAGMANRAADIRISPVSAIEPSFHTHALILKTLTSYAPSSVRPLSQWPYLNGLPLADPGPHGSDPIRLIICSDLYGSILLNGLIKGQIGQPTAQNTVFGWILSGWTSTPTESAPADATVHLCNCTTINFDLQKFWEIENIPDEPVVSADDEMCEEHFKNTHSRSPAGRYIVRLPFRNPHPINIGRSQHAAMKSFDALERKHSRNSDESSEYTQFMRDYVLQSHMTPVVYADDNECNAVYLPHHGVRKVSSTTTKLRVVFNASHKTSNSTSLNDHLLVGPKLKADLCHVLLQWHTYKYVYCADIAQMYRQILLDPRVRNYHRILWRFVKEAPVTDYQLNTVTFGVSCAPFLALRVLRQPCLDESYRFPLGASVIQTGTYVDDCLFGAHDIPTTRRIRDDLVALLQSGCFALRKWASNAPELLADIDPTDHGLAWDKPVHESEGIKILGLVWNPTSDAYQFKINQVSPPLLTKRVLLSLIARLYDPLGWVSPVIISAKIIVQQLWQCKLDWDTPLPPEIRDRWASFYDGLPALSSFSVPRWTGQGPDMFSCELHGFADASSVAYAAVVYIRVCRHYHPPQVSLLASRTKVAPLKPLTIPRLELSAAVLLSKLLVHIRKVALFSNLRTLCWTDASIVLHWLRAPPTRWRTFVANRVAQTQTLQPDVEWRHVPSAQNPADLASRGLSAHDLLACDLWTHGPPWLPQDPEQWPNNFPSLSDDAPLEPCIHANTDSPTSCDVLDRLSSAVSSWNRICRVLAFVLRWAQCLKGTITKGRLTPDDIVGSETVIFRSLQASAFQTELMDLHAGKSVAAKSPLKRLAPFLDENGLVRVGGRLEHSSLPFHTKHPIVLSHHPMVRLLVKVIHVRCLHGGVALTLYTLRQSVWILQAKKIIRGVIYHCLTCSRQRAELSSEIMGNLPAPRVTRPERPFLHTGVDYAGPFQIRLGNGRGRKSQLGYIALFVCFAVKAVHLELVSDYSSSTFVSAFRRYVARRGLPSCMYSDCGTTFVGASTELSDAFHQAIQSGEFQELLAGNKVKWHFLLPAAPHFGGLWEAGMKSVKFHLKRVLGSHTPTFEELSTLLCEIEAALNSRPLSPMSDDIEDLTVLTPGHFLVGGPVNAVPGDSLLTVPVNRLSRWQMLRQVFERFRQLWTSDYLLSLQQRTKWHIAKNPISVGQLVLLKRPNLPPLKWPIARVTECLPGKDGVTRVVRLRTSTTSLTRPVTQLALMPIDLECK